MYHSTDHILRSVGHRLYRRKKRIGGMIKLAITKEQAMEHKDSYAITCCRFEEGTVIEPSHIEDPNLIPDLEESGLIEIPEDCLKIGEVLGAILKKTVDALTPLTPDLVEGYTKLEDVSQEEIKEEEILVNKVKKT